MPPCRQASSVKWLGKPSIAFAQLLHDLLKAAVAIRLEDDAVTRLDLTEDHWDTATRQLGEHGLGFRVELNCGAVHRVLQWVPDRCAGLVVEDLDRVWPVATPVVGPSQYAGQDVFRALQPLVANDRCGGGLGPPAFNGTLRKRVDLLARDRLLLALDAALHGDAVPGVRDVAAKFAWMQPVHDAPGAAAECDGFFSLARSLPVWAGEDDGVNLVGADR